MWLSTTRNLVLPARLEKWWNTAPRVRPLASARSSSNDTRLFPYRLVVIEDVVRIPARLHFLQGRVVVEVIEVLPILQVGVGIVDVAAVHRVVGERAGLAVHGDVEIGHPAQVLVCLFFG